MVKKLVLLLIIAAAAGFGLLNYHFILLDDSLKILKKTAVRYEHTFVDGRGAKKLSLLTNADLIEAGIKDIVSQVEDAVNQKSGQ